jgi:DHA1 family multidrug resistance protein-like MFS transporter
MAAENIPTSISAYLGTASQPTPNQLDTIQAAPTYHGEDVKSNSFSAPRPKSADNQEISYGGSRGSNNVLVPVPVSKQEGSLDTAWKPGDKDYVDTAYSPSSSAEEKDVEKRSSVQTNRSHPYERERGTNECEKEYSSPVTDVENRQIPSIRHEESTDPNLVTWNGPDDPEMPMNFPTWKKWIYTCTFGAMTFCITFASSVFSTATLATAEEFGVSVEVMTLGTSLFVAGFAVGPIVWGPISELKGRKLPLFTGFFIFALLQIPVAVAQNIQTIMICRFLGGLFGSSPLAVVSGSLADMWEPVERGIAVSVFSGATFIGPIAGPIAGGFITMSYLTWRWTGYMTAILGFGFGTLGFLIIPETYAPVLLQRRAKKLRYKTRNWALHSKSEEEQVDFKRIVRVYLLRPFAMLILEPILLLVTIYMSLIYGMLYLFFEAYPITFSEQRGWNLGVGALPFSALSVGVVMGISLIVYTSKTRFARAIRETGHVVPEERLIPMIVGGAVVPIGLFWFAWTSNPHISWVPQVLAGIPIGMGVQLIFLQGLNYIIDVYTVNANSAISANTFVRSLLGAGFPMFASGM